MLNSFFGVMSRHGPILLCLSLAWDLQNLASRLRGHLSRQKYLFLFFRSSLVTYQFDLCESSLRLAEPPWSCIMTFITLNMSISYFWSCLATYHFFFCVSLFWDLRNRLGGAWEHHIMRTSHLHTASYVQVSAILHWLHTHIYSSIRIDCTLISIHSYVIIYMYDVCGTCSCVMDVAHV